MIEEADSQILGSPSSGQILYFDPTLKLIWRKLINAHRMHSEYHIGRKNEEFTGQPLVDEFMQLQNISSIRVLEPLIDPSERSLTISVHPGPIGQLSLGFNKLSQLKLSGIWAQIVAFLVHGYLFLSSSEPTIIQEISQKWLTSISLLQLSKNNIESIDKLSWVYMPILENLELDDNRIVSARPLRKLLLPHLYMLKLHKNWISSCGSILTEMTSPELSILKLDLFEGQHANLQGSISWFPKLQANSINCEFTILNIESKMRVNEPRLQQFIKKKYPKLKIKCRNK